jgi:hypothetical protein
MAELVADVCDKAPKIGTEGPMILVIAPVSVVGR